MVSPTLTQEALTFKSCRACGEEKSLNAYHRKGQHYDARCKACISKVKKDAYGLSKAKTHRKAPQRRPSSTPQIRVSFHLYDSKGRCEGQDEFIEIMRDFIVEGFYL